MSKTANGKSEGDSQAKSSSKARQMHVGLHGHGCQPAGRQLQLCSDGQRAQHGRGRHIQAGQGTGLRGRGSGAGLAVQLQSLHGDNLRMVSEAIGAMMCLGLICAR